MKSVKSDIPEYSGSGKQSTKSNRDPDAPYGAAAAEGESIINSIKEWTKGAATYIQNITNSLDSTLAPDLKAELDGFVSEANDYLHNLTLKEPFNYLIQDEDEEEVDSTPDAKPEENFAFLEHFNNLLAQKLGSNNDDYDAEGEPEKTSRRPDPVKTTARSHRPLIHKVMPTETSSSSSGIIDRFDNQVRPIRPKRVKPAKQITSRNKIEALVAMRLQALKNSGHSGSGTDKHHYTDLPIPSLTAEDIEEIHKIPEKEFQAIVKKKLQEFQNSNPTDSSSPLHASSLLTITDNRLGINEELGIDEDAIIIENDGGEPDKLEGLEDSTFEIVSSSSISNSSLALDQTLPLSTNSSILDKIVPTVVQTAATVAAVPIVAAANGLSQLTGPAAQTVSNLDSTSSGTIDATNSVVLGGVAMSAIAFMGLFSMADYLVSGGLLTPVRRRNSDRKRIDEGGDYDRRVRRQRVPGKIRRRVRIKRRRLPASTKQASKQPSYRQ